MAAILIALCGCEAGAFHAAGPAPAAPAAPAANSGVAQSLGTNRIGEPCRLTAAPRDAAPKESAAAYDAFCGRWEAPSGRILSVGGDAEPGTLAAGGWWRDHLEEATACADPQPATILGDVPAVVLDCALRPGGWPYRAVAARINDRVFLGDAIPASEAAMQRGIGLLANHPVEPAAGNEGERSAAAPSPAPESDAANGLYSAGDLASYRALLRRAQYENFLGNHSEAERRYREALALQQRLLPGDKGGLAFVLMHLALELSNQQRFSEADVLFSSAGELLSASTDATDEARWTSYKALHFANQRRYATALEWARRASALRLELARTSRPDLFRRFIGAVEPGQFAEGDRAGRIGELVIGGEAETALGDIVQSRYLEAAMLVRLDRASEAAAPLAEAERVLDADPRAPRRWMAPILLLRAEMFERSGDLGQAERTLRECIEAQRAVFADARIEGLAEIALGRVLAANDRPQETLLAFERGFAILREQGGGLAMDEALPYFRTALNEAQRHPEQRAELFAAMFAAGQLVRGTVTGQTIALAAARLAASDSESGSLIRGLQDARRRRDALAQTLAEAQASPTTLPPQITMVEQQLAAANADVARLGRSVQAAMPRYNQLIDAPVDIGQALAARHPDEALAQILVGRDGSVGLLIDGEGIEVYEIALRDDEARAAVAQLRRPFDASIGAAFDVEVAHRLYRTLFGPVQDRLARSRHLAVVPSGPLLSLPFAVLVSEPVSAVVDGDYTRVPWLVRDHALTLAPSVQSFIQLRTEAARSPAPRPFIGFGDFVPPRDPDAILAAVHLPPSCRSEALVIAELPRLPATATEVRTIAATMGAPANAVILGADFTEATLNHTRLDDYRVVYLATHGLLPQRLDCWAEPSLVVSRPVTGEDGSDGLLVASEIAELKLDADLVVLSACNTAGPAGQSGGESLSGLTRAFFYAGARALLVTHWQIPDAPTVHLMVGLFRGIAERNLSIDEALQASQVAVASERATSHPLNWAAFTVVGDGYRQLDIPRPLAGAPAAAG
ncbi:MAG: CHAT domain-containing protein [Rhodospirillales bacterium]|nr:CHAT domain-containing protein [Rhodospirillales bacterium]